MAMAKIVSPEVAVSKIEDGAHVIFPGSCANPARFYDAFTKNIEHFSDLTVCSGLSLGDYAFLKRGLGTNFHYKTWQASPQLRKLFQENDKAKVSFIPARLSDLDTLVSDQGAIQPEVAVIQTSIPQNDGTVSLGISVGPNQNFVKQAKTVIAEMSTNMPVTCGDSRVPLENIDYVIESDSPLVIYDTGSPSANDAKIVDFVLSLIPENATVQFGVGAIPDRILAGLAEVSGANLFSGMLSQSLIHFLENAEGTATVVNGELAGDQTLYDYCHLNKRVFMAPLSKTHNFFELCALKRFISINSAVEIDLQGQSNGETLGQVQISGVGGSLDYIQAALLCEGGASILAMPSTTGGDKRSKIVAHLAHGSSVTTPRYCVDYVVTEYGIASLRGKSLWERAEQLVSVAHPKFRESLVAEFEEQAT